MEIFTTPIYNIPIFQISNLINQYEERHLSSLKYKNKNVCPVCLIVTFLLIFLLCVDFWKGFNEGRNIAKSSGTKLVTFPISQPTLGFTSTVHAPIFFQHILISFLYFHTCTFITLYLSRGVLENKLMDWRILISFSRSKLTPLSVCLFWPEWTGPDLQLYPRPHWPLLPCIMSIRLTLFEAGTSERSPQLAP